MIQNSIFRFTYSISGVTDTFYAEAETKQEADAIFQHHIITTHGEDTPVMIINWRRYVAT